MLEVKLFGAGEARFNDRPLPGFPHQQQYLLLSFLLLNRRYPHLRERIASLFWGDCGTSQSRKHLRNCLWRLRHALTGAGVDAGAYLIIGNQSLGFVVSDLYWLDVEQFETTIGNLQEVSAEALSRRQADQLQEATYLFTGELLEGVYDDWCLYDRERLNALFLSASHKLMVFYTLHYAYERAIACGEHILSHDSTCESIHRQMMHLFWLLGDQASALLQYRRCEQILRDELNVSPMKRTAELYHLMSLGRYEPRSHSELLTDTGPPSPRLTRQWTNHPTSQTLARLQDTLAETQEELRHLKDLVNRELLRSRPS
jgi:DNA-binding SARP family transcriptional activator